MDSGLVTGGAEELLDALGRVLPAGDAFEEEDLWAIGLNILLDQILEMVRQGGLPILVAFGLANDQNVALPIDVAALQMHRFGDAQASGIDQAQHSLVLEVVVAGQNVAHFFHAEHGGQPTLTAGADVQEGHLAPQHLDHMQTDGIDGHVLRGGRIPGNSRQVVHVGLDPRFLERVFSCRDKGDEHVELMTVIADGILAVPLALEATDEFLRLVFQVGRRGGLEDAARDESEGLPQFLCGEFVAGNGPDLAVGKIPPMRQISDRADDVLVVSKRELPGIVLDGDRESCIHSDRLSWKRVSR